jgi:hypothetical protein
VYPREDVVVLTDRMIFSSIESEKNSRDRHDKDSESKREKERTDTTRTIEILNAMIPCFA